MKTRDSKIEAGGWEVAERLGTAIIITLCLATLSAPAAVIQWTNTSNGNWSVAANWHPNQVPSTNDTAVITNAGTYTVALNLTPMNTRITIGTIVQAISSGELCVNVAGLGFRLAL